MKKISMYFKAITIILCSFGFNSAFADEPVKLAWTPGPSAPQVAIATEDNLWKESGVAVTPVSFTSGREALEALIGQGAGYAIVSEFSAATALARGQDLVILASLATYNGNKIIINKKSGANDIAGLNGKKVGLTIGTQMQYIFEQVMGDTKVTYVNVAPSDMPLALIRGDIDAALMFDTFYNQTQLMLGEDYAEVPMLDQVNQFLLVSTSNYLKEHQDETFKLIAALKKSDAKVNDTHQVARYINSALQDAVSTDNIVKMLPAYHYGVKSADSALPIMLKEQKWMSDKQLINNQDKKVNFADHIDSTYLNSH
ncbi:ABC transporter substrate-binding protein [Pectobacterium cacticida]|uniref:ABC transporter substrate-binding protein n=1 Tax=Pectobacterium cacticida TaxID=69221 RepID=UPI002FEE929B